jgi:hypothetical protein
MAGEMYSKAYKPSKPTRLKFSPRLRPASLIALYAPRAIISLLAKTAVISG